MKKSVWLYIGIAVGVIALTLGSYYLAIVLGQDPKEIFRIRPIGPILPPPIIFPK